MKRREFIAGLSAAAAWPLAARGQQPTMPVIGLLAPGTFDSGRSFVTAFHRGLSEIGYVEGRNLAVEYRWAEDRLERLPALADDLVRHHVAAIVVAGNARGVLAAKEATNSIPIVFSIGTDPVETGLVASLNRPGGNLTGISVLNVEVIAKRLELLHELVPAATSIAFLVNPTNPILAEAETKELQGAARVIGVRLLVLNASNQSEFEEAFAMLVLERAAALLIGADSLFFTHPEPLVELATRHRVPVIYTRREAAAAGGLMSYGTDFADAYRQIGVYAGRILKGEKPADLPVQQVTKMQLIINLGTAKALGLTMPLALLGRADEVIE